MFPLMALGAGLGQGMEAIQQQQQRAMQQQMWQLQMQNYARQQQEQQRQTAAQAGLAALARSGGLDQFRGLSPMPTAGGGSPDMGGGMQAGGALTRQGGPGRYSFNDLYGMAVNAGFPPGEKAQTMAATIMGESGGNPDAINPKDPGGSYGLAQINAGAHGADVARSALDPGNAFRIAYRLSKGGQDFSPWSVYKSGAYRQYMGQPQPTAQRSDLAMGEGDFSLPSYGEAPAATPDTVETPPRQGPSATTAAQVGTPEPPIGGAPQQAAPQPAQTQANPMAAVQQQVQQGIQKTAQTIPPPLFGRVGLQALMKQIDQVNPGADEATKFMMLEGAQALLAPDAKMQWEMWKQQNDQTLRKEMTLFEHNLSLAEQGPKDAALLQRQKDLYKYEHDLRMEEPTTGSKLLQDDQGNLHEWRPGQPVAPGWRETKGEGVPQLYTDDKSGKQYWMRYGHPPEEVTSPGGGSLAKAGTARPPKEMLEDKQAEFWARVLDNGGTLPPGLSRTGIVAQIMKKTGATGDPGDFIAKRGEVKANTGSLSNMTKMADAAISFEKLASRNFDVALGLAGDAVPTDLGPFFNEWIEKGDTMLGNPEVPRYVAAIITGANEYAKVMSGSTGTAASTVDSRREAREMFSPYLSLPQISQVIAVAKADMANRENTLQDQVKTIRARLGGKTPPADTPTERPVGTPPRGSRSTVPPPTQAGPPPEAIAELKAHRDDPAYLASFEKHFGKAALDAALQQ